MTKITYRKLKAKGACTDQLAKFKELFGAAVELTEILCVEHAQVFNWDWAAANLFSAPARAKYERATAPARAKYERAIAAAFFHAYTKGA